MTLHAVHTVAVIGLGTMGHGIAQVFAAAGYPVRCWDPDSRARDSLSLRVRRNLEAFVRAGLCQSDAIDAIVGRLTVCATEADAVGPAQFVTEAAAENLAIKQDLFSRLENAVSDETILASNSSSFPITQTATRLRRPERAVVTHWFNPPHIVPAVEVVPGQRTAEAVTQAAVALLRKAGKLAIRVNQELPGFLVNRVQIAVMREIWDLVDRGVASPADIDAAIRGSMGFRLAALGPLEIYDFAGLDIQTQVFNILAPEIRSDTAIPATVQQLVDKGHLGVKAGKGFYDYPEGVAAERQARRDALYLALKKMLHGQPT